MIIKVNTNTIEITIDNTTHSISKEDYILYTLYEDHLLCMGEHLYNHKDKVKKYVP